MENIFLLLRTVPLQDCVKAELKEWLAGHAFCRGKFVGPIQQKAVRLEAMLNPFLCNGMICWHCGGWYGTRMVLCIENRLKHRLNRLKCPRAVLTDMLGIMFIHDYHPSDNYSEDLWKAYSYNSCVEFYKWVKVHQGWVQLFIED